MKKITINGDSAIVEPVDNSWQSDYWPGNDDWDNEGSDGYPDVTDDREWTDTA